MGILAVVFVSNPGTIDFGLGVQLTDHVGGDIEAGFFSEDHGPGCQRGLCFFVNLMPRTELDLVGFVLGFRAGECDGFGSSPRADDTLIVQGLDELKPAILRDGAQGPGPGCISGNVMSSCIRRVATANIYDSAAVCQFGPSLAYTRLWDEIIIDKGVQVRMPLTSLFVECYLQEPYPATDGILHELGTAELTPGLVEEDHLDEQLLVRMLQGEGKKTGCLSDFEPGSNLVRKKAGVGLCADGTPSKAACPGSGNDLQSF